MREWIYGTTDADSSATNDEVEQTARQVIKELKLFSLLANVGDAKSLVIHPLSTTHEQLSVSERRAAGVTPDSIRLSIGIEDVADLLADINNAMEAGVPVAVAQANKSRAHLATAVGNRARSLIGGLCFSQASR